MTTTITRDDAASVLADLVAGTIDAHEHLEAGDLETAGALALSVAMRLFSMDPSAARIILAAALEHLAAEILS
ncbi:MULTISPECIES: hypothetical protein [unclassified Microbacterium]|uniref:hypothetical protein n=1 Tax=unclassified Microbacterium TaxID=2609290 RepID=UPI0030188DF9